MKDIKIEKTFSYMGHDCVVIGTYSGYRCGYVKLKPDTYHEDLKLKVHGGITFDGYHTFQGLLDSNFHIGFDCGHYSDGKDFELIKELCTSKKLLDSLLETYKDYNIGRVVRTTEYVENELKKLVEQLIEKGIK